MTTAKLSQGLSDKFLKKKGIIRVSDLDSSVKILDRNYEKKKERMKIPNRIQSDRRRLLRGIAKGEVMLDQFTPTNSVGGGQIAGTVEAGDNPPVKKRKRYIYGGAGSRKMWMNNK